MKSTSRTDVTSSEAITAAKFDTIRAKDQKDCRAGEPIPENITLFLLEEDGQHEFRLQKSGFWFLAVFAASVVCGKLIGLW